MDTSTDTNNIPVVKSDTSLVKVKKIDPIGKSYYGEGFTGYQKMDEYLDLIPQYKEYYYEQKVKDLKTGLLTIIQGFNEKFCYPNNRKLHPYTTTIRRWADRWNADIIKEKLGMVEDDNIFKNKEVRQIVKTRSDGYAMTIPSDNELEAGVRTLGGELLNDAMQMLRDDQELEDYYPDDVLMKRRNYIINVFGHTTRLVHGKAALMLKASEEKRNTASFLMNLLSKATAGKLSDEELGLLETTYVPKTNEPA